jgi:hypothetical protein
MMNREEGTMMKALLYDNASPEDQEADAYGAKLLGELARSPLNQGVQGGRTQI